MNRMLISAGLLMCAIMSPVSTVTAGEVEGFIEPYRTINVAAVESGIVDDLAIEEGDRVEAGQKLAELNQDVLKASLEIARAGRDATSSLKSAQAELTLRTERLAVFRELHESGNASIEEVRRADLEHKIASARVMTAQENLEIKRLEFERIHRQLDRRTVRSPIEGFVTEVYHEIGEFVSPNDPVIATVVQLNPLRVTFSVPQKFSSSLKKGADINLRIEGDKKLATAEIELVSRVVNAESQTVRIRVRLPNPDLAYRSGLKAFLDVTGMPERLTEKPTTTRPR